MLGVVGLGRIGGEVARRAQAFGMRVLAYDPYLAPSRAKAMQVEQVDLDTLLRESDYITVHMPLTDQTRYMIDEAALAKTKKGVRLFNCARGGIIKESALVAALKSGHVAAAGLDVYEDEPLPADHELRRLPNVTLTPHLGASTAEAQESVGIEIAEAIADALRGGIIRNAVNVPSIDAATLKVLGPYLDLGAKLGTLVQQIAPAAGRQAAHHLLGPDRRPRCQRRHPQHPARLSPPDRRRGGQFRQRAGAAAAARRAGGGHQVGGASPTTPS